MSQKNSCAITVLTYSAAWLCLAVLGSSIAFQSTASAEEMPAAEAQAWAKSYDPATKRRFIPVELWTGSPWSGKREIVMGKADLIFGDYDKGNFNKHISGPKQWRHNVTDKQFGIYDRRQKSRRSPVKIQYFALREDKQALGRVYDSRYTRALISPGAKFPLGYWTQGETRVLTATRMNRVYKETGGPPTTDPDAIDRTRTRTFTRLFEMEIKDIDFTYYSMKHCLRFHWRTGSRRRAGNVYEYIYCPRHGQVYVDENLGRKKRAILDVRNSSAEGISGAEFKKLVIGNTLQRIFTSRRRSREIEVMYFFVDEEKLLMSRSTSGATQTQDWSISESGKFCYVRTGRRTGERCWENIRVEGNELIGEGRRRDQKFTLLKGKHEAKK
ncbi:MAG: hypothetical protein O7D27_04060 [Alphaproteobacteria bacterium]|nr:hypothetical protein [Alphaproteobacteria bacterium]